MSLFSRAWATLTLATPERTDGWGWTRRLVALAAALNWAPRALHVPELYSNAGITMPAGLVPLPELVIFTPLTASLLYATLWVGIGLLLWGRWPRLGAWLLLVPSVLLVFQEAINIKAYDRLLLWQELALVLSPVTREALPGARYFLLIVYMGLYGQTGWGKVLEDRGWWDGSTLAYHLANLEFGRKPFGLWLSHYPTLLVISGGGTVLFEALFPLLVLVRRVQPWLLLVGACFHVGTLLTMDVGAFWAVAIAAYPVLLHPSHVLTGQGWIARWEAGRKLVGWGQAWQR